MSKWQKRVAACLAVILIILAAGSVALHMVLERHLGELLNKYFVPVAEEKLKVDVNIDDAGINLLGGSLNVNGITVGNPDGFSEPAILTLDNLVIQMNLPSLLRGGLVHISGAEVTDAVLTIVRQDKRPVNLKVVADRLSPAEPAAARPEAPPEGKQEKTGEVAASGFPKATVDRLLLNTRVRYVDHAIAPKKPVDFTLDLVTTVDNLATFEEYAGDWGDIRIEGSLSGNTNLCVTDLRGRLGPMADPVKSSFDLSGDIASVDIDLIQPYLALGEFTCSSLSLELKMRCRDGEFDSRESHIDIKMKNVVPTGKFAKTLPPGFNVIPSVSVPIPLGGTVSEPELNFTYAFLKTVSDNFQDNIVDVAKALADDLAGDGEKTAEALTELLGGGGSEGKGLLEGLVSDEDIKKASEAVEKLVEEEDAVEDLIKGLFNGSLGKPRKKDE
jgi:hypothetical protein